MAAQTVEEPFVRVAGESTVRLETVEVTEVGDGMSVGRTVAHGQRVLIPHTRFYQTFPPAVDGRYRLTIVERDGHLLASAVEPQMVASVLSGVVPEVRTGQVRVMGVARVAGVRAKVAVASTDPTVDPIAACVGRRANRRAAVVDELAGERIDFIVFHPEPQVFLANAMAPAEVESVRIDGAEAVVEVAHHQMAAAVGSAGLNGQLAGGLLGIRVFVEPR